MPTAWIPPLMRDLTDGRETVPVAGRTVREVVGELDRLFPGIRARICVGDELRPGLNVAVGSAVARFGLNEAVGPNDEVHFLPAIGGGSLPA